MKSGLTRQSSALLNAIFGLSLLCGCATENNNSTQTANAIHDGPWPMQSKQKFLKHSLSFGGYQTSDISAVISATGSDSQIRIGSVGWEADDRKTGFHFDLNTPRGEVLQVALQGTSNRNGVTLTKFEMTTDLDSLITGTMTSPSGLVWSFEFADFVPLAARQSTARGRIQVPGRGEIAVAFTEDAVPPKSGIGRLVDRVAVEFLQDGRRIGLLNGYMKPAVWIDPKADEPTHHAIAASCAALVEMSNRVGK